MADLAEGKGGQEEKQHHVAIKSENMWGWGDDEDQDQVQNQDLVFSALVLIYSILMRALDFPLNTQT